MYNIFFTKYYHKYLYYYLLIKSQIKTKYLYRKKCFSIDFYKDNIIDLKIWSNIFKRCYGYKGLSKKDFDFVNDILDCKIYKIGSLQYKFIKIENDCLFLQLHIREGVDISPEELNKSYSMSFDFYKNLGYKFSTINFLSNSYLFSPDFYEVLDNNSNILKYVLDRKKIKKEKYANDIILFRIFSCCPNKNYDYKYLPENTSLQRNIKMKLIKGVVFYTYLAVKEYKK